MHEGSRENWGEGGGFRQALYLCGLLVLESCYGRNNSPDDGVGVTRSTDHLIVKMIIGRRFDFARHKAKSTSTP